MDLGNGLLPRIDARNRDHEVPGVWSVAGTPFEQQRQPRGATGTNSGANGRG